MTVKTFFSREFNLDTGRAEKAALISEGSGPAHVLLTLIEAFAQPDGVEVDFDPPRLRNLYVPADLS
ncbi:MAG: type II toxin-antitoxin system Phd/YefM family antitoxin [Proteobacteria bacterium]|nr:type II toxin-antitoxin system Phd/YefM family antitoxin [Pseudomonadota bacterium]